MTAAKVFVPPEVGGLQAWVDATVLGSPEVHGAAAVSAAAPATPEPAVVLAIALALGAPLRGDACFHLGRVAADAAAALARAHADDDPDVTPTPVELPWPEPGPWKAALTASPIVRVATAGADAPPTWLDDRPVVVDGDLVYTQRQWVDESVVARGLLALAAAPVREVTPDAFDVLTRLLPIADDDGEPNQQHRAAQVAASGRLAVVVGGPGTGKTHTLGCLLAALVTDDPDTRIGLAAPTGKAAARMTEAISAVATRLRADDAGGSVLDGGLVDRVGALRAVTLHRLLGPRADHRGRFRHNDTEPLPYDVVVLDELSMLALPMMARLLEAIGPETRLVLVGDPDQLESIDVGTVLGDIVRAAEPVTAPLHDRVVRLVRQHRTAAASVLGPLRDAVRDQRDDDVLALLDRHRDPAGELVFVEVGDGGAGDAARAMVRAVVEPPYRAAADAAGSGHDETALDALASARVLCAHRRGPYGVETWNGEIEAWLFGGRPPQRDYVGRALLATRNDPRTGIVNGDTGMVVARPSARAVFRRSGVPVAFDPAELEELETAFAMTVHKTQGSEYETVVVIHPPVESPLVGRELLYTAITRASRRLVLVGSTVAIGRAVVTRARRVTGLADRLS